ncbi:TonB-dependent receptor [Terriglobus albidus]|uniref:TonB-dependent receptor n=1 Tax=Terriglobus albidus TaxID=1592106 RepID=UPI0021DFC9A4|nr:TonB-dependent receptor [Terriglobus albidus]
MPASLAQIAASAASAEQPAQDATRGRGFVYGTVRDPLGAVVPGALVELLAGSSAVATGVTDAQGHYRVRVPSNGRFQLRSSAPTFNAATTAAMFFSADAATMTDLIVATPTDTQQVSITASGTPTPIAQVAASVTILDRDWFKYTRDIQEPLRYLPGAQITQTGQAGGTSGLYIRGGNTNANKVLIDGIPANDLGGSVEFANIASTGINRVEVLREPNSALYGSEALAGVVSLTTRRGSTPLPQLEYSIDGGNFNTWRQESVLSGAAHRVDYLSSFARFDTDNSLASSAFHNVTFAENLGYQPNSATDIRFTLRHVSAGGGKPNALALYGLPDSAYSAEHDLFVAGTLENRTTEHWHNLVRYGGLRLNYLYNKSYPAGNPVKNASGVITSYIGNPVTIRGANGYVVSGQATLNFPGTYPSITNNLSQRDFVYAQSDYRLDSIFGRPVHTLLFGGFKYESERGTSASTGSPTGAADRNNYSTMLEMQGDFASRLFYTVGTGLENNAVYGFAATPRASAAYYLVRPTHQGLLGGTKLHTSFSKGIKGPSIYIQNHSLYGLLAISNPALISQYGISQAGPEQSRSYDGGVDQEFGNGHARLGLTYFHNEYNGGLEFVSQANLVANGFSGASNQAFSGGAYVNSLAYRAQGLEVELEMKLSKSLFARGGYTLLDAKVQNSFASSALKPTINPLFPGILIGSSGPLKNNRPFRRARNSGYFGLQYTRSRWNAQLSGTLVGLRDDSDFLSGTMLLPNQNLGGAYQRLELTGEYRVSHHMTAYAEVQNLLNEHYSEAFGYRALPFNFRSGLRITLGGESWKLR